MRLDQMNGIFVGLLDEDEMRVFEAAVKVGYATRSYEGAGGLLGLAKVKLIPHYPDDDEILELAGESPDA